MKSLVIHEPARLRATNIDGQRALTDDPREGVKVIQYAPFDSGVDVVLAAPARISSVFIGYISGLQDNHLITLYVKRASNGENVFLGQLRAVYSRRDGMAHYFAEFDPIDVSQINPRFVAPGGADIDASNLGFGVLMASDNRFRAQWGHEWGAGRPLDDTSAVERLPSGSFAIDPGIVTSGYQWTFGDLSDDERERLYDIHKAVGRHRSVLVIEDDDRTPGLYERMHWGLLQKLDTYARVDPTATTWNLQVADWL